MLMLDMFNFVSFCFVFKAPPLDCRIYGHGFLQLWRVAKRIKPSFDTVILHKQNIGNAFQMQQM